MAHLSDFFLLDKALMMAGAWSPTVGPENAPHTHPCPQWALVYNGGFTLYCPLSSLLLPGQPGQLSSLRHTGKGRALVPIVTFPG